SWKPACFSIEAAHVVTAGGQSALEVPAPGTAVSGLGFVAGWKCSVGQLTYSIDNGPTAELLYCLSPRYVQVSCDHIHTGFIAEQNWNLDGNVRHTIRVFDDGFEFAEASFSVATFGTEFLRGASGIYLVPNFPKTGKEAIIEWEENLQNFVITDTSP